METKHTPAFGKLKSQLTTAVIKQIEEMSHFVTFKYRLVTRYIREDRRKNRHL